MTTRRQFLGQIGGGAVAAGLLTGLEAAGKAPTVGKVKHRTLGKTGLRVSEIGFGGHSWAYKRVPDGKGGLRRVSVDEATRMIGAGLDLGVNFLDACTPSFEHTTPGEVLRRLKKRDQVIISARCCHKMKGRKADKDEVYKFVDERLKMWRIDHFDLLMLSNTENDTPTCGYWEMSHSIEALQKVKKQGKVRFTGFGSHFTPELFLKAIDKYGKFFDVCSVPYNVRHRAAEKVIPAAKKANLGVVTIKPFARGSLLKKRDLSGKDAGLPRDMIAFVLANAQVDVCICGCHTASQMRENFSASWTKLTPATRKRLEQAAAEISGPQRQLAWLENGWRHA